MTQTLAQELRQTDPEYYAGMSDEEIYEQISKETFGAISPRQLRTDLGELRPPTPMDRALSTANVFGQGASLGIGDEAAGVAGVQLEMGGSALAGFANSLYGRVTGDSDAKQRAKKLYDRAFNAAQAYTQTRDLSRTMNREAYDDAPVASFAAEGLGGLATSIAAGGPLTGGSFSTPALARAGAIEGGAYGFNAGEGIENRLMQGLAGAGIGGALGAAPGAVRAGFDNMPSVQAVRGGIQALRGVDPDGARQFMKNFLRGLGQNVPDNIPDEALRARFENARVSIGSNNQISITGEAPRMPDVQDAPTLPPPPELELNPTPAVADVPSPAPPPPRIPIADEPTPPLPPEIDGPDWGASPTGFDESDVSAIRGAVDEAFSDFDIQQPSPSLPPLIDEPAPPAPSVVDAPSPVPQPRSLSDVAGAIRSLQDEGRRVTRKALAERLGVPLNRLDDALQGAKDFSVLGGTSDAPRLRDLETLPTPELGTTPGVIDARSRSKTTRAAKPRSSAEPPAMNPEDLSAYADDLVTKIVRDGDVDALKNVDLPVDQIQDLQAMVFARLPTTEAGLGMRAAMLRMGRETPFEPLIPDTTTRVPRNLSETERLAVANRVDTDRGHRQLPPDWEERMVNDTDLQRRYLEGEFNRLDPVTQPPPRAPNVRALGQSTLPNESDALSNPLGRMAGAEITRQSMIRLPQARPRGRSPTIPANEPRNLRRPAGDDLARAIQGETPRGIRTRNPAANDAGGALPPRIESPDSKDVKVWADAIEAQDPGALPEGVEAGGPYDTAIKRHVRRLYADAEKAGVDIDYLRAEMDLRNTVRAAEAAADQPIAEKMWLMNDGTLVPEPPRGADGYPDITSGRWETEGELMRRLGFDLSDDAVGDPTDLSDMDFSAFDGFIAEANAGPGVEQVDSFVDPFAAPPQQSGEFVDPFATPPQQSGEFVDPFAAPPQRLDEVSTDEALARMREDTIAPSSVGSAPDPRFSFENMKTVAKIEGLAKESLDLARRVGMNMETDRAITRELALALKVEPIELVQHMRKEGFKIDDVLFAAENTTGRVGKRNVQAAVESLVTYGRNVTIGTVAKRLRVKPKTVENFVKKNKIKLKERANEYAAKLAQERNE